MKINAIVSLLTTASASFLNADLPEAVRDQEIVYEYTREDTTEEDLTQERDFLGRDGVDGSVW